MAIARKPTSGLRSPSAKSAQPPNLVDLDGADSEVLRLARERYESGRMDLVSLEEAKTEFEL